MKCISGFVAIFLPFFLGIIFSYVAKQMPALGISWIKLPIHWTENFNTDHFSSTKWYIHLLLKIVFAIFLTWKVIDYKCQSFCDYLKTRTHRKINVVAIA